MAHYNGAIELDLFDHGNSPVYRPTTIEFSTEYQSSTVDLLTPESPEPIQEKNGQQFSDDEDLPKNIWQHAAEVLQRFLNYTKFFWIIVIYSILGAFAFMWLEIPADIEAKREQHEYHLVARDVLLFNIRQIHEENHENREFKWKEAIIQFEKSLDMELAEVETDWTFWMSILYAGTIYTTIGYGNIACKTGLGRLVTIIYAVIGIPLMIVILDALGGVLHSALKGSNYFCSDLILYIRVRMNKKQLQDSIERQRYIRMRKRFLRLGLTGGRQHAHDASTELIKKSIDDIAEESVAIDMPEENEDDESSEKGANADVDANRDPPLAAALILTILWIVGSAAVFCIWEDWTLSTSIYFFFISTSTIGFGDVTPDHPEYMIATFGVVIVGLSMVSVCIQVVQEWVQQWYTRLLQKMLDQYIKAQEEGDENAARDFMSGFGGGKAKLIMPLLSKSSGKKAMEQFKKDAKEKGIDLPEAFTELDPETGRPAFMNATANEINHIIEKAHNEGKLSPTRSPPPAATTPVSTPGSPQRTTAATHARPILRNTAIQPEVSCIIRSEDEHHDSSHIQLESVVHSRRARLPSGVSVDTQDAGANDVHVMPGDVRFFRNSSTQVDPPTTTETTDSGSQTYSAGWQLKDCPVQVEPDVQTVETQFSKVETIARKSQTKVTSFVQAPRIPKRQQFEEEKQRRLLHVRQNLAERHKIVHLEDEEKQALKALLIEIRTKKKKECHEAGIPVAYNVEEEREILGQKLKDMRAAKAKAVAARRKPSITSQMSGVTMSSTVEDDVFLPSGDSEEDTEEQEAEMSTDDRDRLKHRESGLSSSAAKPPRPKRKKRRLRVPRYEFESESGDMASVRAPRPSIEISEPVIETHGEHYEEITLNVTLVKTSASEMDSASSVHHYASVTSAEALPIDEVDELIEFDDLVVSDEVTSSSDDMDLEYFAVDNQTQTAESYFALMDANVATDRPVHETTAIGWSVPQSLTTAQTLSTSLDTKVIASGDALEFTDTPTQTDRVEIPTSDASVATEVHVSHIATQIQKTETAENNTQTDDLISVASAVIKSSTSVTTTDVQASVSTSTIATEAHILPITEIQSTQTDSIPEVGTEVDEPFTTSQEAQTVPPTLVDVSVGENLPTTSIDVQTIDYDVGKSDVEVQTAENRQISVSIDCSIVSVSAETQTTVEHVKKIVEGRETFETVDQECQTSFDVVEKFDQSVGTSVDFDDQYSQTMTLEVSSEGSEIKPEMIDATEQTLVEISNAAEQTTFETRSIGQQFEIEDKEKITADKATECDFVIPEPTMPQPPPVSQSDQSTSCSPENIHISTQTTTPEPTKIPETSTQETQTSRDLSTRGTITHDAQTTPQSATQETQTATVTEIHVKTEVEVGQFLSIDQAAQTTTSTQDASTGDPHPPIRAQEVQTTSIPLENTSTGPEYPPTDVQEVQTDEITPTPPPDTKEASTGQEHSSIGIKEVQTMDDYVPEQGLVDVQQVSVQTGQFSLENTAIGESDVFEIGPEQWTQTDWEVEHQEVQTDWDTDHRAVQVTQDTVERSAGSNEPPPIFEESEMQTIVDATDASVQVISEPDESTVQTTVDTDIKSVQTTVDTDIKAVQVGDVPKIVQTTQTYTDQFSSFASMQTEETPKHDIQVQIIPDTDSIALGTEPAAEVTSTAIQAVPMVVPAIAQSDSSMFFEPEDIEAHPSTQRFMAHASTEHDPSLGVFEAATQHEVTYGEFAQQSEEMVEVGQPLVTGTTTYRHPWEDFDVNFDEEEEYGEEEWEESSEVPERKEEEEKPPTPQPTGPSPSKEESKLQRKKVKSLMDTARVTRMRELSLQTGVLARVQHIYGQSHERQLGGIRKVTLRKAQLRSYADLEQYLQASPTRPEHPRRPPVEGEQPSSSQPSKKLPEAGPSSAPIYPPSPSEPVSRRREHEDPVHPATGGRPTAAPATDPSEQQPSSSSSSAPVKKKKIIKKIVKKPKPAS